MSLTTQPGESIRTEQAYPGQTGHWKKGYWLNKEATYQTLNGEAIVDGDMVLHPTTSPTSCNPNRKPPGEPVHRPNGPTKRLCIRSIHRYPILV